MENPHFKFKMTFKEMMKAFMHAHPELTPNCQNVGRFAKKHGYHRFQQKIQGSNQTFYANFELMGDKGK